MGFSQTELTELVKLSTEQCLWVSVKYCAEAASSFPCDDLLKKPQVAHKAASPPVEATWGMSSSIKASWGAPSGEDVASSHLLLEVHLVLKMQHLLLGLHLGLLLHHPLLSFLQLSRDR